MKARVETYGCALNRADSDTIRGILQKRGFEITLDDCDLVVLNSCTVKTPTDNKIKKRLRKLVEEGVPVIVAGCLPAAQPEIADEFPGFSFIGVNTRDLGDAVDQLLEGKRFVGIREASCKLTMPNTPQDNVFGVVAVSQGCLGECAYCITRKARGRLKSYGKKKIVDAIRKKLESGAREIWITSQDTGAWGKEVGDNLAGLLEDAADIPGDHRIRVGMMNIRHAHDMLDRLYDAFSDHHIYDFIHIPIQSGSDRVLKDMNRRYTVQEFRETVEKFRRRKTTISTDVIVGYPTETKQDFQETLELLKQVKPDILNINRYWRRPGTHAASLKGHPTRITKERSRETARLFEEYGEKQNKKWVGWRGRALVTEKSGNTYTARNQTYKPIVIPAENELMGKWTEVEITDATYYDFRGKTI